MLYNNETMIKDLTVGELKDIITECILSTKQVSSMIPSSGGIPISQLLNSNPIDDNTPRC